GDAVGHPRSEPPCRGQPGGVAGGGGSDRGGRVPGGGDVGPRRRDGGHGGRAARRNLPGRTRVEPAGPDRRRAGADLVPGRRRAPGRAVCGACGGHSGGGSQPAPRQSGWHIRPWLDRGGACSRQPHGGPLRRAARPMPRRRPTARMAASDRGGRGERDPVAAAGRVADRMGAGLDDVASAVGRTAL
ncbi:MAG: hypothetical protein AVDCRST_MAG73-346, partial [uncultured Thermomicrobiales bacterium]